MSESKCPNCGYCPHCGRSDQQKAAPYYPIYPQPLPVLPWTHPYGIYPYGPITVTNNTNGNTLGPLHFTT